MFVYHGYNAIIFYSVTLFAIVTTDSKKAMVTLVFLVAVNMVTLVKRILFKSVGIGLFR